MKRVYFYFFCFTEYNKERFKEKSGLNIFFACSLLSQKVTNVLLLKLRIYHFICNKVSFSFSVFRKICISSLMNAQNRLKCFCYSRKAFSGTVSDFLATFSVGTYHFVSSMCSQKHFWFSCASVDYSFTCSHIPIPFLCIFTEFVL